MESSEVGEIQALERDAHGQLLLTLSDGSKHPGVVPVRAFPLEAPREGVALVSPAGRELFWIEHLDELPESISTLVEEMLSVRDFTPRILRLLEVSTFATPSTWLVDTDRGRTAFTLKTEEDIRRLDSSRLVITDRHGIQYLIDDQKTLDVTSRKLLDRFL